MNDVADPTSGPGLRERMEANIRATGRTPRTLVVGFLAAWCAYFLILYALPVPRGLSAAGMAVLAVVAWHAWSVQRVADDGIISGSAWALLVAVLGQAALGIWTLLEVVPLTLGIAHQMGAAIVFGIAVWHLHCVRRVAT